jgi:hypothetical protein
MAVPTVDPTTAMINAGGQVLSSMLGGSAPPAISSSGDIVFGNVAQGRASASGSQGTAAPVNMMHLAGIAAGALILIIAVKRFTKKK